MPVHFEIASNGVSVGRLLFSRPKETGGTVGALEDAEIADQAYGILRRLCKGSNAAPSPLLGSRFDQILTDCWARFTVPGLPSDCLADLHQLHLTASSRPFTPIGPGTLAWIPPAQAFVVLLGDLPWLSWGDCMPLASTPRDSEAMRRLGTASTITGSPLTDVEVVGSG